MEREWQEVPISELKRRGLGLPGSCISCMSGTDTAIGLHGSAEWLLAGMMAITGDSMRVAHATLADYDPEGWGGGRVPVKDTTVFVRLCEECATYEPGPPGPLGRLQRTRPIPVAVWYADAIIPVLEAGR